MITFKETKWTTIFYPSQNKQNLLVKGENEGGQKSAPPPGPHLSPAFGCRHPGTDVSSGLGGGGGGEGDGQFLKEKD